LARERERDKAEGREGEGRGETGEEGDPDIGRCSQSWLLLAQPTGASLYNSMHVLYSILFVFENMIGNAAL